MPIINAFPEGGGGGSTLENYTPFTITTATYKETSNYKTALIVSLVSSTKWTLYLVSYGSSSPGTSTTYYPNFTFTPAVDLKFLKNSSTTYTFEAGKSYTSTKSYSSNSITYTIKQGSTTICSISMSTTTLASSKQEFMTLEIA